MSSPPTLAQTLLIKASEDEAALKADGLSVSILGFHAQQAIEKLMKALLSAASVPFQFTHDLEKLRALLIAVGETLPSTPLSFSDLTDYAVVYRYDLLFQFAPPDRAELIETVRLIREHVVARIAAISAAP